MNLKSILIIGTAFVASTLCFADDTNDLGNLQPGTEITFHVKGFIPGTNDSYDQGEVSMGNFSPMECSLEFKGSSQDRNIDAEVNVTVKKAKHNGDEYRINGDFVINGIPQDSDVYISCYPIDEGGKYSEYDTTLRIGNLRSYIQRIGGTIVVPGAVTPDKF